MKKLWIVFFGFAIVSSLFAQFTGPSRQTETISVEEAHTARIGSYVFLQGHVVAHLREEYYQFRDATGEIRVEIPSAVWQGREVSPETQVRIHAEVDRSIRGRYLYVKSLQIME